MREKDETVVDILNRQILIQLVDGPKTAPEVAVGIYPSLKKNTLSRMAMKIRHRLTDMEEGKFIAHEHVPAKSGRARKVYHLENHRVIDGTMMGNDITTGEEVNLPVGRTLLIYHELGTSIIMLEEVLG